MKRSKHTLSHYNLRTGILGKLMPIQCVPVLPGDTMQGYNTALIRMAPLNTPVMHPMTVRVHTWFVPNRLVWDQWEDFITGGNSGDETPTIPTISINAAAVNSLSAYLGAPPMVGAGAYDANALPIRACNLIFNTRYRDQDLVAERLEDDNSLPNIAWEKDYFTTARPWTQRGTDVSLPIGTNAGSGSNVILDNFNGTAFDILTTGSVGTYSPTGGTPNVLAPSVNEFRAAFSLQRYQEARARYGARFTEYLRYLGITPSDARLQEPEYVGGGTTRVNFSEVLQTTETTTSGTSDGSGVGDLYGHGIAGLRTGRWRKFFEEHGYLISFCSIRPKALYVNGVQRDWLKTTKEDYFQKELVNIGQQEVYTQELHQDATPGEVLGYQDRYSEYKSHPSTVANEFRNTLNSWHLGRELSSSVALNQAFVECDPPDRIFQTSLTHQVWCSFNNHLVARRMVPKRSTPRIL